MDIGLLYKNRSEGTPFPFTGRRSIDKGRNADLQYAAASGGKELLGGELQPGQGVREDPLLLLNVCCTGKDPINLLKIIALASSPPQDILNNEMRKNSSKSNRNDIYSTYCTGGIARRVGFSHQRIQNFP